VALSEIDNHLRACVFAEQIGAVDLSSFYSLVWGIIPCSPTFYGIGKAKFSKKLKNFDVVASALPAAPPSNR